MSQEISQSFLNELKELARNATPGPWEAGDDDISGKKNIYARQEDDHSIHDWHIAKVTYAGTEDDARYIAAANPKTILDLIAEIERLQARDSTQSVSLCGYKEIEVDINCQLERIKKEADWLAYQLADDSIMDPPCGVDCNPCELGCRQEKWIEAARKAAEN